jgi:hypothetical protein
MPSIYGNSLGMVQHWDTVASIPSPDIEYPHTDPQTDRSNDSVQNQGFTWGVINVSEMGVYMYIYIYIYNHLEVDRNTFHHIWDDFVMILDILSAPG